MKDGLEELRFYKTANERCDTLDGIIAMITKSIETLENKKR